MVATNLYNTPMKNLLLKPTIFLTATVSSALLRVAAEQKNAKRIKSNLLLEESDVIHQAYSLANELLSSSDDDDDRHRHHNDKEEQLRTLEDITTITGAGNNNNLDFDSTELLHWITNNGGHIHPNAHIKELDPKGSSRGVFVKINDDGGTIEGIEKGAIICKIPWELIIKPKQYAHDKYWDCDGVNELHRQLQLGEDSFYAPYIRYLLNQPRGRLPQDWTENGLRLLDVITNKQPDDQATMNRLPPTYTTTDFQQWVDECQGEDTSLTRHAVYQFISRDEDTLLVPFFDMHNHSNDPEKLNTHVIKPKREGGSFVLRATRYIEPGEQIFISYNLCHPCWHDETFRGCKSFSNYGTSDIFFVYGFIEDWPQYWKYNMMLPNNEGGGDGAVIEEIEFCVVPKGDTLQVRFIDDTVLQTKNIAWFAEHLLRLTDLKLSMKEDREMMQSMPRYEWDMAWGYYDTLVMSISLAVVQALDSSEDEVVNISSDDSCTATAS